MWLFLWHISRDTIIGLNLTIYDYEYDNFYAFSTLSQTCYFQYDTDFYILDKYPLAVRPFYTMPDPNNPVKYSMMI